MRVCTLCRKLYADEQAACPADESPTVHVEVEPLPAELAERFAGAQPLALGATGALYLVDGAAAPKVLKVLARRLTEDPAERARYRRELRKQLTLTHPNLPRVFEEGEVDQRVWVLRDYVAGETLAVRLHRSGPFTAQAAYSVIAQLAAALAALHRVGVSHHDLKPGHVVVGAQVRGGELVRLIDATLSTPLLADGGHGAADYAAPEVMAGEAATFRSDLYALGCLSFELLAGAPPVRAATADAVSAAQGCDALPELALDVPEPIRALLVSLLSKDATRRPFSAQQVRRSIEPLLKREPSTARSRPQSPAAALRTRAPAARHGESDKEIGKDKTPETTVELDVDDLEQAIQEGAGDASRRSAVTEHAPDVATDGTKGASAAQQDADDSAPTIALHVSDKSGAEPEAQQTAAGVPPSSDRTKPAASAHTGTRHGLGPVRVQDIAAADRELVSTDAPTNVSASRTQPSRPTKPADSATRSAFEPVSDTHEARFADDSHSTTERVGRVSMLPALTRGPNVLWWAAGGLLLGLLMLRLVLGPNRPARERTRSNSVVVHVPVPGDARASGVHPRIHPSGHGLIGGDISAARRPPPGAERAPHGKVPTAPAQVAEVAAGSGPAAQTAPESGAVGPSALGDGVPTVSAAKVGRGIARSVPFSQVQQVQQVNRGYRGSAYDTDQKVAGRRLYQSGRFREAARAYRQATQRDGSDAGAFAGLGGSLLAAGDVRGAIAAYQRAVQLEPSVSGFQAALGRAYLARGDRARARVAYARALKLDPNNQAARAGIARVRVR